MPRYRTLLCLLATFTGLHLAGCARVGPDYTQPAATAPPAWQAGIDMGLHTSHTDPRALAEWWTILKDPLLTDLVRRAAAENLDLEQARARLLAARARRDMSAAGLFPALDAGGAVSRSRGSSDRGSTTASTSYSTGLDAGWELDLFGGRQRSVEAAQAQLEASEADLRDVLVSLLAEVTLNYIEIRNLQTRLEIAKANVLTQEESLELIQARAQSGLISELALQQAVFSLAGARAQIPTLETSLAKNTNALAVLLGHPPGSLSQQLHTRMPLPQLPPSVAVGIPAETLERRPDVRTAERQLAAQTAQIGAAMAERYPVVRLSGSVGLDALSAGRLFNSGSGSYSFGPSVSWRIFDGGATEANIRLQSALQQEALARYQATVLAALEEVEGALVAYALEQERHSALGEAAEAAHQAAALADLQYQSGLVNFTEVLDTRRSLLSFQEQEAESAATMIGNLIRLYKALGGGWTSPPPETTTFSGKQL